MKTSSKKAIENRLSKLVASKKVNKSSLVYGWALSLISGETEFRPVFSQGSTWKFSSLVDKTTEFINLLDGLKLSYTVTNDSPRGGKTGVLVTIVTKVK